MQRGFLLRLTMFGVLALVLTGSLHAAPEDPASAGFSSAEQQVFAVPHLAALPATATLRYRYRQAEAGKAPVDDEVVLATRLDSRRGRVVQFDYLHGERHLDLPEVDQASSNPLILYFLEADVRAMHRRLGGAENYFRRRIRLALAEAAQVRPVTVSYGGRALPASEVLIQPYAADPQAARYQGMAHKTYRFVLSPRVPGGVVELRTRVDDPAGGLLPLVEEVLTLREEQSRAAGGHGSHGPRWPTYLTEGGLPS